MAGPHRTAVGDHGAVSPGRTGGPAAPLSVLVADDDAVFREALVDLLAADDRYVVVGVAATGAEVRRLCRDLRPALVLLDVRMPEGGAELARALVTSEHPPVVVAVSAQTGLRTVAAMVAGGARGYLAKGRLGATLPDALARVVAGDRVLDVPGAEEALRLAEGRSAPGT